jgi:hypothetical protein
MQSAFDVQSTSLNISRSTTAKDLSHSALELRRTETTASASHLEAYLKASPVEQLPKNHVIIEHSACQLSDGGPQQCLDDSSLNANVMHLFWDSVSIISYPEVIVVDVERTLTRRKYFICPQNVM